MSYPGQLQRARSLACLAPFVRAHAEVLSLAALAIVVRLPGLGRPLLGNFATKNVVYAMIARNWATGASSIWRPALDSLSGDGLALHLLEFPLAAYLAGGAWRWLGGSLDVWGRLVSVLFSAAAVALLYDLARRWHGKRVALAAALALALSPVSIIYGQAFMLEPSLVCLSIASIWGCDRWMSSRRGVWLIVAALALAGALLTKVYIAVLLLPLAWMCWTARRHLGGARLLLTFAVLLLATLPAALWYAHAARAAAPGSELAERVFYSVRDSAAAHLPPHPLLGEPRFYARLTGDLMTVMLTPVGAALLAIGLARRDSQRHLPWLAAYAILVLLLPRKFYEMNYYALVSLPPFCLIVGLGWDALAAGLNQRRLVLATVALTGALCAARYAARPAFFTPDEDRGVLAAASAAQRLAPVGEPVVAVHGSTLDLLYYTERRGWFFAAGDATFDERIAVAQAGGARIAVVVGPESDQQVFRARFPAMESDQQLDYAIYRLDGGPSTQRVARRQKPPVGQPVATGANVIAN